MKLGTVSELVDLLTVNWPRDERMAARGGKGLCFVLIVRALALAVNSTDDTTDTASADNLSSGTVQN